MQTALSLAQRAPGKVSLVTRHLLRIEMFDADPCWISALCMDQFERADYADRRRMIAQARNRGSVPHEIAAKLFDAIQEERLALICGEVADAPLLAGTRVQLMVGDDEEAPIAVLNVDRVVLATGFDRSRPGGEWLDRGVREFALSCHQWGYPMWTVTFAGLGGFTWPALLRNWSWAPSPAISSACVMPPLGSQRRDRNSNIQKRRASRAVVAHISGAMRSAYGARKMPVGWLRCVLGPAITLEGNTLPELPCLNCSRLGPGSAGFAGLL